MMVMVKCTMTTITHPKEDTKSHLMLQQNQYTSPLAEDRHWNQVIEPTNLTTFQTSTKSITVL